MSGSEEQGALARLARQSRSWSLGTRLALLTALVVVVYPLLSLFMASQRGVSTWTAAALAGGICWLGAVIAMLCTAWSRGPQGAMFSLLFGMFFRMGLPLMAGVVLSRRSAELEAAGFFGLILCFYLVTLVAETLLVLPLVQNKQAAKA